MLVAVFIIWLEAIIGGQAKLKCADNIEVIIICVETEDVEAKIAIVVSKLNINDIRSAKGVLNNEKVRFIQKINLIYRNYNWKLSIFFQTPRSQTIH